MRKLSMSWRPRRDRSGTPVRPLRKNNNLNLKCITIRTDHVRGRHGWLSSLRVDFGVREKVVVSEDGLLTRKDEIADRRGTDVFYSTVSAIHENCNPNVSLFWFLTMGIITIRLVINSEIQNHC